MLTSIKEKLITNVTKISLLNSTASPPKDNQNASVNLYAGAEILTHYQKLWAELHEINEGNAKKASAVAEDIKKMHDKISSEHKSITKIVHLLNTPPDIHKCIENCVIQMKNLYTSFEEVEKGLIDLEVCIEDLNFRKTKAEYINCMISQRKKEIAEALAQSTMEEELKRKKVAAERQQVFEEAFNDDIETYKMLGAIPKIETKVQSSALLEEIQLDLDEKELESFLNDK